MPKAESTTWNVAESASYQIANLPSDLEIASSSAIFATEFAVAEAKFLASSNLKSYESFSNCDFSFLASSAISFL